MAQVNISIYTYKPNGTGTTRTAYIKNLGWHFARYGGVAHADEPLYCIEPWRNYGASTSGNSVDRDVTLSGSGSTSGSNVWYALPSARREAIGLILLYSDQMWNHSISVTTTRKDSNPNVPLSAGIYYVKELGHTGSAINTQYTCSSTNPQKVTITAGQTASVSFRNVLAMGRIEIRKTTNTGSHVGGWTFRVQDAKGNTVGYYTTDETGYAVTENLPLGRYTVYEAQSEDPYWNCELGFHDVTVKAGATTVDAWLNREQGLAWFYKKTNTGESVEGWHITVYADEDCTQEIGTLITNEDGKVGYYLDPGTYWATETGDEHGRFEDEYWMVDETVQKFEIKPHEDTEITFTNVQYGKLKITKTVEGDGSVEGWQFRITDSEGKILDGSPFTTDKDGVILSEKCKTPFLQMRTLLPDWGRSAWLIR